MFILKLYDSVDSNAYRLFHANTVQVEQDLVAGDGSRYSRVTGWTRQDGQPHPFTLDVGPSDAVIFIMNSDGKTIETIRGPRSVAHPKRK